MKTHLQVISEIVMHDLCSGCGVCTGVCPSNILKMSKQTNGDLAPDLIGVCPPKCDLCLRVCPFAVNQLNITQLASQRFQSPAAKQHEAVGFYIENYVGYSEQHRSAGASGGMTTWVLQKLLAQRLVDAVITITSDSKVVDQENNLFCFNEMTTPDEVQAASGSFYYPISLGQQLRHIQELRDDRRYAIVGLPCTLKGVALAMAKLPRLRSSIRFTLGLVCGHLPNFFYTEYLTTLSSGVSKPAKKVHYRIKQSASRANNFCFQSQTENGSGKKLPFHGAVGVVYTSRMFQLNACNYCDDLFAEVADASFMDAWLPEYMGDPNGHSIITVRNPELIKLVEQGITDDSCTLHPLPVEKVFASQESQWLGKSERLRGQIVLAEKEGRKLPPLRQVGNLTDYYRWLVTISAENWLQTNSKNQWQSMKDRPEIFIRKLRLGLLILKINEISSRIIRVGKNPKLIITKLFK